MTEKITIAQVGFGMFGSHEVARSIECIVKYGVSPFLGRIGYACLARELAEIEFDMVAIGAKSKASAEKAVDQYRETTGKHPKAFYGETPWENIINDVKPDILVVATPDNKHFQPALYALKHGIHVLCEKPLALHTDEVIKLVTEAEKQGVLIGSDNHKEYDPDHLYIARELLPKIGPINYARAYLEEPLEVSTSTFKWVAESGKKGKVYATPFGYVGIHWVSLFQNMYGVDNAGNRTMTPVHVNGHGQKNLLRERYGIDAIDSTVVDVVYDNGAKVVYENNWITPEEFSGLVVNQGHEIVGANGKIESDQQNRGLVYWVGKNPPGGQHGKLSQRTANNHFFRKVLSRHNGLLDSYSGYGMDAILAFMTSSARVLRKKATPEDVSGTYIDGSSQILPCAVIEAGNSSIWKNQNLLENKLIPDASCSINVKKGITVTYTGGNGTTQTETIYDGNLV
ncbi:Gfo/Idh/MocA family protein [Candidatus Latescibacterota bacterium]